MALPAILVLKYRFHRLRRGISNASLLRHREYKGFLVSMHQSGTHWLKHMLAVAITRKYQLPPPRYSHANEVIGGVRSLRVSSLTPHLVSTHSIPYLGFDTPWLHRVLPHPPYVVLVRDIRASLVANYEKWKSRYGCGFTEFLQGDPRGRRFNSDLWWCIRFCNAWGDAIARVPGSALPVRYEDLRTDTLETLRRVNDYWRLELDDRLLREGIEASTKERMSGKQDPAAEFGLPPVREDGRHFSEWFSDADRVFFDDACGELLQHRFGFDYADWEPRASSR